ncbi:glycoside hydrolase family 55 protein [Calycina marina]|uniref:Glycoside hydrolase family 55 protein n=1 Tax=Calycina marina TaxID=1763456 RepID=A0A9P7Z983_9HELO|nr:glycoside hydrolase family 55 protein [Calycina marina]
MLAFSLFPIFVALRLLLLTSAAPTPSPQVGTAPATSSYWLASIKRQGTVAFGDASFQVFRNVKDFGAVGDGTTDDTAAINSAITAGNRCGQGCDSSTVTPAIVYFPPGTYAVSAPIVQYYYTQFIGDAVTLPTLKATAGFTGMAVIDADPYGTGGFNWYINQNNFFRQVRNFVIDLTAMPVGVGAGIHWQVAQATSLQNIVFNMRTDGGDALKQVGIFMDNGSGGFFTDLAFNGGLYGAFLGSQQFTTRNMTFNNCKTAMFMNWNWLWTISGVTINNCAVGIDMANGGADAMTVGSVLLLDSKISNTPIGVSTAYASSPVSTNGTLIIENVDMSENVPAAVSCTTTNSTVLAGNTVVASWAQGRQYTGNAGKVIQAPLTATTKAASLLDSSGAVVTRSKPQYETEAISSFKSAKDSGAKGDGVTDDTAAIQALFDSATANDVVYFDQGAYLITDTVKVPKNIRITGEMWPLIMAGGSTSFKDQANPNPVFQVGQVGDSGSVEMSDLIFETVGPQPGAVLMQWNLAGATAGTSGLWDVHFRVGGTAGTLLQSDKCSKNLTVAAAANPECVGAFMLLHITPQASNVYLENTWGWVSDHELDLADHNQINIYNGRGLLIESTDGPVWLYGTSFEHNVLYNYQVTNASNIWMGQIQTETPYFQSNPDATTPFTTNIAYSDPVFSGDASVNKAWGLRVTNSKDIHVYGAGLYSFFDNYSQVCLDTASCQENMVSIESSTEVHIFALATKAAVNMVSVDGTSAVLDSDNRNNFCATIAHFEL